MFEKTYRPAICKEYLKVYDRMEAKAPRLLPPLRKALILALEDHATLYGISKTNDHWTAVVKSQGNAEKEYRITKDEQLSNGKPHFECTCKSYELKQYVFAGKTFCKHTMAVHLLINGMKAGEKENSRRLSVDRDNEALRETNQALVEMIENLEKKIAQTKDQNYHAKEILAAALLPLAA